MSKPTVAPPAPQPGFLEFLETAEAKRAPRWQIETLAAMEFPEGVRPRARHYRMFMEALDTTEPCAGAEGM